MVLVDQISGPDGWHDQASRLLMTHAALGMGIISAGRRPGASERTRGRQIPDSDHEHRSATSGDAAANEGGSRPAIGGALKQQAVQRTGIAPKPHDQILNDQMAALASHIPPAYALVAEPDDDFDSAREALVGRDNEIRSLQASLELTVGENERLSEQLADSHAALNALKAQLESGAPVGSETEREEVIDAVVATNVTDNSTVEDPRFETVQVSDPIIERAAGCDGINDQFNQNEGPVVSPELTIHENARPSESFAESDMALDAIKTPPDESPLEQTAAPVSDIGPDEVNNAGVGANATDKVAVTDCAGIEAAGVETAQRSDPTAAGDVERGDLTATLNEMNKQRELETRAFLNQLDAMLSRAVSAEERLAEAEHNLLALSKEGKAAVGEHLRLSTLLVERGLELQAVRSQLDQTKTTLATAETKNRELVSALDNAARMRLEEVGSLVSQLEVACSRAFEAEARLAETRQNLSTKLELLQDTLEVKLRQIRELKQSRAMLVAGSNALLQRIAVRDKTLVEAEVAIKLLADRVAKFDVAPDAGIRAPDSTAQMMPARLLLASTIGF